MSFSKGPGCDMMEQDTEDNGIRITGTDGMCGKEAFMDILVIDSQGGGMGRQLVGAIKEQLPQAHVTAVGTNSTATAAMLKAGADAAATGENAVIVGCRRADVIVGPIGIVIADALYGEVTPAMAVAVGQSRARRVLIPVNHCDNIIAGVAEQPMGSLVESAIRHIKALK